MKSASELIKTLAIVDGDLRNEAIRQPLLFIDASRYRVAKMRAKAQAEAALEAFISQQGLRVRAKGGNGERITNDYVKARVQKNPRYRELQEALNTAEQREELSKLLLEAFRMRRDALRILTDAQWSEAAKGVSQVEREVQERRLRNRARELQARRERNGG